MARVRLTPGPVRVTPQSGPHVGETVLVEAAMDFRIAMQVLEGSGLAIAVEGRNTEASGADDEQWVQLDALPTAIGPTVITKAIECPLRFMRYRVRGVDDAGATFDIGGETR